MVLASFVCDPLSMGGCSHCRLIRPQYDTHHPQFKLFEAHFPAVFELFHPLAIPGVVGNINDYPHEVISIENTTIPPVTFHFLRLVTCSPEVIHDFEDGVGDPLCRDIPAIIEPQG